MFDNLDEIDKLLQRHKLPNLTGKEIDILDSHIYLWNQIHGLKIPIKETPGLDGFRGDIYQIFKERVTPVLYKISQKLK